MASRKKAALAGTTCKSKPELDALTKGDRNKIDLTGLTAVDSVDIDNCFSEVEPNANRWDYYVGIGRRGELYLEVHAVSDDEVAKLIAKSAWLKDKITSLGWPQSEGRPFFVAPTKGISPFAMYGVLSKRLAVHKMTVVMKGDRIADLI